ncbi:MAG: WYL domain-containing protein [Pseudoclavibacter sp.]
MSGERRTKIAAEERLFNLVLALWSNPTGLAKQDVFDTVPGYRGTAADRTAQERMFERDKRLLRDAGLPLRAFDDPAAPDDNQLTRYRIDGEQLEVPAGFALSDGELAIVGLAAALWQRAASSPASRSALMKLRALGFDDDPARLQALPALSVRDPHLAALQDACSEPGWVRFDYTAAGYDTPVERVVWPLALVPADDRWNVCGVLADGSRRTFLLDRISGSVERVADEDAPAAPDLPEHDWAQETAVRLQQLRDEHVARIRTAPGSETETRLRRRARGGDGRTGDTQVPYLDEQLFAAELAAAGPEAMVISPPTLRAEVRRQLERVRAAHTGAPAAPAAAAAHSAAGTHRRATGPGLPDRLVLLLDLVPWALRHPGATVAEAAAEFQVTPAAVHRSILTIAVSGLPGETRAYLPGDLFDIDWDALEQRDQIFLTHTVALERGRRLDRRDLSELVVGLHYLRAVLSPRDAAVADRAAAKLAALARSRPNAGPQARAGADDASAPRSSAAPAAAASGGSTAPGTAASPPADPDLAVVTEAAVSGRQVRFTYTDARGRRSDRLVTPIGTRVADATWYVVAWNDQPDGPTSGVRNFRLDRMDGVRTAGAAPVHPGDVRSARSNHARSNRAARPGTASSDAEPNALAVTVDVDESAVAFLSWYQDQVDPAPGRHTLIVTGVSALVRAVCRRAGRVRVAAPAAVRDAVRSWAEQGLTAGEDGPTATAPADRRSLD